MIPELGLFAAILAFALSLANGTLGLVGPLLGDGRAHRIVKTGASLQALLMLLSFACLAASFLRSDFSVLNVATNSNTLLPTAYQFAATWGSHEGSLLLWVLMLAGWTAAFAWLANALAPAYHTRVIGVLSLLLAAFLLFMLATSSPFIRLLPAPVQGRDLNPVLQDPLMVIHPPMLYMGYVGFAVAFACATAALIEGRLNATWARWARPWAAAAWGFLTIGIMLGSWWAYRELGWGGWWFWDPVENASLMPWLAGTALLHSLAVTDKRDSFKSWTILLAITTFSLSLLGTFLVRSGVLTSVHAFATDPKRGVFILALLMLVIGTSLLLYAARARKVGLGAGFSAVSRESMLLANNLLMSVALAAVMLGTLYPLFLDVLQLGKISVGPPYFESVLAPILLPAVFLMAAAPFLRWKGMSLAEAIKPLRTAFVIAIVVTLALVGWMGRWSGLILVSILAASWLAFTCFVHLAQRLAKQPERPLLARLQSQPPSYYGMLLAHLGVAVFIVGVALVKGFGLERDVLMAPGQTESLGAWRITFVGVDAVRGPNYTGGLGVFELTQGDGTTIRLLQPQKRNYLSGGQTMSKAAIESGVLGDVYISLGEPAKPDDPASAWAVRLYLKPFVNWIWFGAGMMALGGFLAAGDKRYRKRRVAVPDAAKTPELAEATA